MTKKHSKLGNRAGKPAYRTPSSFIVRKRIEVQSKKPFRNYPLHTAQKHA
jgi:hypothetical protein